jgi:hypothetical protein
VDRADEGRFGNDAPKRRSRVHRIGRQLRSRRIAGDLVRVLARAVPDSILAASATIGSTGMQGTVSCSPPEQPIGAAAIQIGSTTIDGRSRGQIRTNGTPSFSACARTHGAVGCVRVDADG